MLSSRSARLAALLALVLLFGWSMRAWRKGATTYFPPIKPAATAPAVENSQNVLPDE